MLFNFISGLFYFPIRILYFFYSLFFIFQYQIASTCISIYGEAWICMILNPDYVFTTIIIDLMFYSLLIYLMYYVYLSYLESS